MSSSYISARLLCKYLHLVLFVCLLIPAATDAAGLGKLKVKSALGEMLDADIELVEASASELPSLTARIANDDEYIAAGLQGSIIPTGIRINAVQRADGVRLLHLTSIRPINEPFLELLISVNSETLHLVRQYTMLLDPPNSKLADDGNPLSSSANSSPIASRSYEMISPSGAVNTPAVKSRKKATQDNTSETSQLAEAPVKPKRHAKSVQPELPDQVADTKSVRASGDTQTYLTQKGDIFGKVAQQYQPTGISLKRVMAVLYKANPDAFLDGDINQLKAGQMLRIPEIVGASLTRTEPESHVTEAKPVAKADGDIANSQANSNSGYVLKISPGNTNTQSDEQDNNQARINQSAPNGQATIPATETLPAPPEPVPVIAAPQAPAVASVVSSPPPQNWLDNLLWIFIGMLISVAIFLLVFVLNLRRQAKMRRLQDGVFGSIQASKPSTANADTIFGQAPAESGVDLSDKQSDSLPQTVHPHDQTIIDIDEIDPLVEAEIYISYGRDEQAESILTHALEATPDRHELSYRLLVIYAGHHDLASFERYAKAVKEAAERGAEEDVVIWGKVAILGSQLDAENPLYNIENMQPDVSVSEAELATSSVTAHTEEIDPFSEASIATAETLEFPPLEVKAPAAKRFEQLSAADTPQPIDPANIPQDPFQAKHEEHLLEFTLPEQASQSTVPKLAVVKKSGKAIAKK